MRKLLSFTVAALLTASASGAMAAADQGDLLGKLTEQYLAGYETQDNEQITHDIIDALELLNIAPSALLPTSHTSPLAMAILALESAEGPRDRVRYHISYGMTGLPNPPKHSPLPLSFIQVDRYSLGATIRQDIIDTYGSDHVAPPEEFDVGPHVSWRLVTRPIQGARAQIIAAGRTELTNKQAQQTTCLTKACLFYGAEQTSQPVWNDFQEKPLTLDVAFPTKSGGLLTPAAAIELLTDSTSLSLGGQSREEATLPEPFFEAMIEINLGQDTAMIAKMRQGGLMDDAISANWKQLTVIPSGDDLQTPSISQATAYECRRGTKFPDKGRLCP